MYLSPLAASRPTNNTVGQCDIRSGMIGGAKSGAQTIYSCLTLRHVIKVERMD